jgi:N-methylhydantoinase A
MLLDLAAAEDAITTDIARPLGIDVLDAADGILKIAVTKMSYAVKGVSTERGLDAASFALMAYGGAGPLHACAIAREIGISRVIIPHAPGHFCAFGMLHSDLRYDNVRTWLKRLDEVSFDEISAIFDQLVVQGRSSLAQSGVEPARESVGFAADMRYVGQEHAVTVELSPDLLASRARDPIKQQFDAVHLQRYGTSAPAEPAEIVSLRASVAGVLTKPPMLSLAEGDAEPAPSAERGSRSVYFGREDGSRITPIFARSELLPGNRIVGPALIEEHASTTVLLPHDVLVVDRLGNLVVAIEGSRA